MPRILVVDDEPKVAALLAAALEQAAFHTEQAHTFEAAARLLDESPWDLVVSDLRLDAGRTGIDLLRQSRRRRPALPFIILTGQADLDTAIEAVRAGAFDYLTKPADIASLTAAARRALQPAPAPDAAAAARPPRLGRGGRRQRTRRPRDPRPEPPRGQTLRHLQRNRPQGRGRGRGAPRIPPRPGPLRRRLRRHAPPETGPRTPEAAPIQARPPDRAPQSRGPPLPRHGPRPIRGRDGAPPGALLRPLRGPDRRPSAFHKELAAP